MKIMSLSLTNYRGVQLTNRENRTTYPTSRPTSQQASPLEIDWITKAEYLCVSWFSAHLYTSVVKESCIQYPSGFGNQ